MSYKTYKFNFVLNFSLKPSNTQLKELFMALSIPKIITNSSTGVIVYTSADLARACELFFHTRALCAKKAEVNIELGSVTSGTGPCLGVDWKGFTVIE